MSCFAPHIAPVLQPPFRSITAWLMVMPRATPLHALASWGAVGFARAQILIENHALDAHFSNKDGVANAVAELVKYGGKSVLNIKDSVTSRCALHVAALADNDAFIAAACSQGANVDQASTRYYAHPRVLHS